MDILKLIIWPEPILEDQNVWIWNRRLVEILCQVGEVTKWLKGKKDQSDYQSMPYKCIIEGVPVEFLPHWGYIEIGGSKFDIPQSDEQLMGLVRIMRHGQK